MVKISNIHLYLICAGMVVVVLAIVVRPTPPSAPPASQPRQATPMQSAQTVDCGAVAWQGAAHANQASLYTLAWSPFGRLETGWATYAPLIAHEIGTPCPADSARFARAYDQWQAHQGLVADGVVKPSDFDRLRNTLAIRRPFVQLTAKGLCPTPPDEATLVSASPTETYGGKTVRLRPGTLAAYRKMVAAARTAGVGTHPPELQLISGYRGPLEEAARCAEGGCNTTTRASCSAHRTGLALDLYLEPSMGVDPTSIDDINRGHMAGSLEYRWLVANGRRFGFLPYAYEPWHWEWTGERP